MPVDRQLGFEAVVYVGADAAASTATILLGGVTKINPPEWARDAVDVTDSDSPSRTREFIPGLADAGEMTIELNFDPNHATETEILEMMGEKTARLWEIKMTQFATGKKMQFRGFLIAKGPATPQDAQITQSITVKVTGAITWLATP
jgi:predicted secreted protein